MPTGPSVWQQQTIMGFRHFQPAAVPIQRRELLFLQEKNNLTTTIQTAIANLGNFATQKRTQIPTTVDPDSAPGVNFLDHNPNFPQFLHAIVADNDCVKKSPEA